IYSINAAIAAFGYALTAVLTKQALGRGAGMFRIAFVMNWVFVPFSASLLFAPQSEILWPDMIYPVLTGGLFFLGQAFTFAAIRFGDVSLQTPVMGTKAVFTVLIAVALGTETVSVELATASCVAMLGVALLGFSGNGCEKVGLTLLLSLLSSLFFAGSDSMMGFYAGDFGLPMFLFLAFLVNALLSFTFVPFFGGSFSAIPKGTWPWVIPACLLMAGQALLLNYTLAHFKQVAAINVIYNTRGLWSVVLGVVTIRLLSKPGITKESKKLLYLRFAGALLMCTAIAILFNPVR
ncbi:MAG: hypothetical protein ACO398_11660, partial [Kiritimatiellia bacterium]